MQRLITEDGVDGVTSNPAIFQKAIAESADYQDELARLRHSPLTAEARYESLVIPDIQAACDMLLPTYLASQGETGYASLEVSPALAHDVAGTVATAQRLRHAVDRENLFIKVPGTPAGVLAFEQLTAAGVRINVTLIFSVSQYVAVAQAYLRGAQRWLDGGGSAAQCRSVASVFLSRVDTRVDQRLDAMSTSPARMLRGKAGVALAKCCHARYREIFHGPAFASIAQTGVRAQTPLWASTGNKDPANSDLRYVEPLIGPESINTVPEATLAAFRDHGCAAVTLMTGMPEAHNHTEALRVLGIDLGEVGESLQTDGVRLFHEAYEQILMSVVR